jgi:1,4-dihydroxy-2-naphthoyl-CoA hydrolase
MTLRRTMQLPDFVGGFTQTLGLEFTEFGPDRTILTCEITPELLQPYGIVHGGVHCSIVETAASVGAALWFGDRGNVVGVANHTNFLRATRSGKLTATATPVHRGRTQQLWLVTITDEEGRDIARGEVRLANLAAANALGDDGPDAPAPA